MTDQEITELCAEAMGIECDLLADTWRISPYHNEAYNPLHDDEQAMALVKRFQLWIEGPDNRKDGAWNVVPRNEFGLNDCFSTDLNRAICLCAAKVQKEKETQ